MCWILFFCTKLRVYGSDLDNGEEKAGGQEGREGQILKLAMLRSYTCTGLSKTCCAIIL